MWFTISGRLCKYLKKTYVNSASSKDFIPGNLNIYYIKHKLKTL